MSKVKKLASGTELPLVSLKGKDYLEVKYRLVWFCEENKNFDIETSYLVITDEQTIARSKITVKDESGNILRTATGTKRETKKDFSDHTEKAETGSVGRALALLGYGTQFDPELEEGSRIVDAPVVKPHSYAHDQPSDLDGVEPTDYIIPFGKFKQRSLEEVGADQLRSYVEYLESKAKKDGKDITGVVADFILRASEYVGSFENGNFNSQ